MRSSPPVSWSPPESTPVLATLWQRSSPVGGPAAASATTALNPRLTYFAVHDLKPSTESPRRRGAGEALGNVADAETTATIEPLSVTEASESHAVAMVA